MVHGGRELVHRTRGYQVHRLAQPLLVLHRVLQSLLAVEPIHEVGQLALNRGALHFSAANLLQQFALVHRVNLPELPAVRQRAGTPLASLRRGLIRIRRRLHHQREGVGDVGDVSAEDLLPRLSLLCRLRADNFTLELGRAAADGAVDSLRDLRVIVPDVLLGSALERDLGAHDGDEDANLIVVLVDLVGAPVESLHAPRHHVRPSLEQQRDPVREPEHVESRLDNLTPQADARLHDQRVSLRRQRGPDVRSDPVGREFLHDPQPQVVLTRRGQARAVGLGEPRVAQQLLYSGTLRVGDLLGGHAGLESLAELRHDSARVLLADARKLLVQKRLQGLLPRLRQQVLDEQLVLLRRGRVVLRRRRGRGHDLRAPPERRVHVLPRVAPRALVSKVKLRVRGHDGELPQVAQHLVPVRGPVTLDDDAELGAVPRGIVRRLLRAVHVGFVLLHVDVEDVPRSELRLGLRADDLDGQTGGLLTPDERHLGPESELASRLPHSVLGTGEHAPEHVRDVVVRHSLAVVLDGDAEERLGTSPLPAASRVSLTPLRRLRRGFGLILEPLLLLLVRLDVRVQRAVLANVRLEPDEILVLTQRHLLHRDVHVGEHPDALRRIERVLDELTQGGIQRLARVLETRDALVVLEELRRGLALQVFVPGSFRLWRHLVLLSWTTCSAFVDLVCPVDTIDSRIEALL
mmetsp:Transcript_3406/g.15505  ORF Transcript_3406/g.15505 Transcript_3406/m.15505 type:complete len:691 (-) Transcript_3406:99-2171(-)